MYSSIKGLPGNIPGTFSEVEEEGKHMGKRKLHDQQFIQCDWTGFPMLKPGAFLPMWESKHDSKLQKQGHYLNWETVVSVAHDRYFVAKTLEEDEYQRIMEYVQQECGGRDPSIAPHWKRLTHFGGELELPDYLEQCTYETGEIDFVFIPFGTENKPVTKMADSNMGRLDFYPYLTRPITGYCEMITTTVTRKTKTPKLELVLMYYGAEQNPATPINQLASQLFKFQIHGDCILAKRTKEFGRHRYVNYTVEMYAADFNRTKRKREEIESMTTDEFKVMRQEGTAQSKAFEQRAFESSQSVQPVRKGAKMKPAGGKQLARLKREVVQERSAPYPGMSPRTPDSPPYSPSGSPTRSPPGSPMEEEEPQEAAFQAE